MVDLNNYKGIYFEDDNEKFQCPDTGAHFKFEDLCQRMERIRIKRGDPLVEFDAHGNKVFVKSVELPSKSLQDSQMKESKSGRSQMTQQKNQEKNRSNQNSSIARLKQQRQANKRQGQPEVMLEENGMQLAANHQQKEIF